jgi:CRP/FNR family transcriptional regulator, cyclic AMP receptor protein
MTKSLLVQFQGPAGKDRLLDALQAQELVENRALANELTRYAKLEEISSGQVLIDSQSGGRDLFLILAGKFAVRTNGNVVAQLGANQYVGEIGLLDPKGRRTASVVAVCDSVVARIKPADFCASAEKHPRLWRTIASGLARRLLGGSSQSSDSVQPQSFER